MAVDAFNMLLFPTLKFKPISFTFDRIIEKRRKREKEMGREREREKERESEARYNFIMSVNVCAADDLMNTTGCDRDVKMRALPLVLPLLKNPARGVRNSLDSRSLYVYIHVCVCRARARARNRVS